MEQGSVLQGNDPRGLRRSIIFGVYSMTVGKICRLESHVDSTPAPLSLRLKYVSKLPFRKRKVRCFSRYFEDAVLGNRDLKPFKWLLNYMGAIKESTTKTLNKFLFCREGGRIGVGGEGEEEKNSIAFEWSCFQRPCHFHAFLFASFFENSFSNFAFITRFCF